MDKWIDQLYQCNCWHPVMDVKQMLACQCNECGLDCHKHKFQTMVDIVDNEYGFSAINRQTMLTYLGSMKGIDKFDHAYVMNKKLVVEKLIQSTPLPVSGCNHNDPGLLRAQGYTVAVPTCFNNVDSVWKPYTIEYPVKPTPTSIELPLTRSVKTQQLYQDAQANANRIWTQLGIRRYVDLSNGRKDPTTNTVIRPIYNRSFLVTFQGKQRKAYNIIGECFNFYNGDQLASGPYDPSFKYKSATEMGHHNRINNHSHTNIYRSDCSLWYTYHQHMMLSHPGTYTSKDVTFEPPQNDRQRFKMWSTVTANDNGSNACTLDTQMKLMTI